MSEPDSLKLDRYFAALNPLYIAECALIRGLGELRRSDGDEWDAARASLRELRVAIATLRRKTNT